MVSTRCLPRLDLDTIFPFSASIVCCPVTWCGVVFVVQIALNFWYFDRMIRCEPLVTFLPVARLCVTQQPECAACRALGAAVFRLFSMLPDFIFRTFLRMRKENASLESCRLTLLSRCSHCFLPKNTIFVLYCVGCPSCPYTEHKRPQHRYVLIRHACL